MIYTAAASSWHGPSPCVNPSSMLPWAEDEQSHGAVGPDLMRPGTCRVLPIRTAGVIVDTIARCRFSLTRLQRRSFVTLADFQLVFVKHMAGSAYRSLMSFG